jgi:AcrR family transcriptional regulator
VEQGEEAGEPDSSGAPDAAASTDHGARLGRRERKKLRVRMELASAALRLFEERGYADTTVDDIAEAADVSRRTFFRYFARKEDVLSVDRERKLEIIRRTIGSRGADEPLPAVLRRTGVELAREYASDSAFVRAQVRVATREPELTAYALQFHVEAEEVLTHALAEQMRVDPHVDLRPHVVADAVMGAIRTAVSRWLEGNGDRSPVPEVERAFDLVEPALVLILGPAASSSGDVSPTGTGVTPGSRRKRQGRAPGP